MAYILKVDGTKEELGTLPAKPGEQLAVLQQAVGGYIEVLPLPGGGNMVLDEEGKLKGYQYNPHATALLMGWIQADDYIVGDVVITKKGELK